MERRERRKTSLTQLIGCYREKAKKSWSPEKTEWRHPGSEGLRKAARGVCPSGPGSGWVGRKVGVRQKPRRVLVLTALPIALALLSLPVIAVCPDEP